MKVKEESEKASLNSIFKKAKRLSEEALQIAVKRRGEKDIGEEERNTYLYA